MSTRTLEFGALLVFLCCCLLTFPSTGADAQSCKKYVNDTGYRICTPYLDYEYFLPQGPTEWIIEALLYHAANAATAGITLTPGKCEEKLQAYTCASIFNRCDATSKGAAPRQPCRSLCEDVLDACADFYAANPTQTPPNCTANPVSHSTYTFSSGETVEVQCFKVDNDIPKPKFPVDCAYPYAYNPKAEEENGFPCSIACPFPLYPEAEIDAMDWINRFGCPIILFTGLILLGMQGYRRKVWWVWPRLWIFVDGVVLSFTNIAVLTTVFKGGYAKIGCHNDAESVQGDDWLGMWTNWWQYMGSWGSSVAFAVIATNVLIVTRRPSWMRKVTPYLNYFNFFAIFVPPFVILIVTQSLGYTGYCAGIGACFFKTDVEIGAVADGLGLLLLLIPFSVAQLWGYSTLLVVIWMVYKTTKFEGVIKQIRLVGYLISYGIVFTISLSATYQGVIKGPGPTTEYITCETVNWINSFLAPLTPPQHCDLQDGRPIHPFSLFYVGPPICLLSQLLWIVFFGKETVEIFLHGKEKLTSGSRTRSTISGVKSKSSTKSSSQSQSRSQDGQSHDSQS